jgi:hypothetical protein
MDEELQKSRAAGVWDALTTVASEKSTITYEDLAKILSVHHRTLKYPLEIIKNYCLKNELPALTTLVVGKKTGKPGAGNGIPEVQLENEESKVFSFEWAELENPFGETETRDLRDMFAEVAAGWNSYASLKTVSKSHPIHGLVTREIPMKLRSLTGYDTRYKSIGSDGQGNITTTPWAATLDLEVTDTAQEGYYLVYLISADLKKLVLSVAFGATAFEAKFGSGKKLYVALADAVRGIRSSSSNWLTKMNISVSARTSSSTPALDVFGNSSSLKAYEECSIYHVSYDLQNLPPESTLTSDHLALLGLYRFMTGSLLLPEPEAFVIDQVDAGTLSIENVKDFVPRSFSKRNSAGVGGALYEKPRRSKNADAIGKIGEEQVFRWEKERLSKEARPDLAEKVIWHREDPDNRTPGWDITSYEIDGSEIFIEVKSSNQKVIKDVELTPKEWIKATENSGNGKYRIYLLSSALTKPTLEIVIDPHILVSQAKFSLSVSSYQLRLGSNQ